MDTEAHSNQFRKRQFYFLWSPFFVKCIVEDGKLQRAWFDCIFGDEHPRPAIVFVYNAVIVERIGSFTCIDLYIFKKTAERNLLCLHCERTGKFIPAIVSFSQLVSVLVGVRHLRLVSWSRFQ